MFRYQKNGSGMGIKKRLVLGQTYYFLIRGIFLDSFLSAKGVFPNVVAKRKYNPSFLLLTFPLLFMTKRIHLVFRSLYKFPDCMFKNSSYTGSGCQYLRHFIQCRDSWQQTRSPLTSSPCTRAHEPFSENE